MDAEVLKNIEADRKALADQIKKAIFNHINDMVFAEIPQIKESVKFATYYTDKNPYGFYTGTLSFSVDGIKLYSEWPESFAEYFSEDNGNDAEDFMDEAFDEDLSSLLRILAFVDKSFPNDPSYMTVKKDGTVEIS